MGKIQKKALQFLMILHRSGENILITNESYSFWELVILPLPLPVSSIPPSSVMRPERIEPDEPTVGKYGGGLHIDDTPPEYVIPFKKVKKADFTN